MGTGVCEGLAEYRNDMNTLDENKLLFLLDCLPVFVCLFKLSLSADLCLSIVTIYLLSIIMG